MRGLKYFLLYSLNLGFAFDSFFLAHAAPSKHRESDSGPSKDFDLTIDIVKLMESVEKFKAQSELLLEKRIEEVGEEQTFRSLKKIYDENPRRDYFSRTLDTFQIFAEQCRYQQWQKIPQADIDAIEAIQEFLYAKSLGGGRRSVLLYVDPAHARYQEITEAVKAFNKSKGITSSKHLRMGDYLSEKLKSLVDVNYRGESITHLLSDFGQKWD